MKPFIWNFLSKLGLMNKIPTKILQEFIKKYSSNGKTLDIGCGKGLYRKYFPNSIGIDIKKTPAVDFVIDAHNLSIFQDEEFDNILCVEVLEHLYSTERAISEMYRVLKKNGILILTTRFIFPLHDIPIDYYRFTKYGLKHLLKDFKIIEIKEEANTLETLAVLFQRIGFQCETLYFPLFRYLWFILAKISKMFSFIITEQSGEMGNKEKKVKNIITSGYYVACKKI